MGMLKFEPDSGETVEQSENACYLRSGLTSGVELVLTNRRLVARRRISVEFGLLGFLFMRAATQSPNVINLPFNEIAEVDDTPKKSVVGQKSMHRLRIRTKAGEEHFLIKSNFGSQEQWVSSWVKLLTARISVPTA